MNTFETSDLLSAAWRSQVEADLARLDRLQIDRTTVLLAQNSARGWNPDGPAMPCGTASRRRAEQLWRVSADWLEALPRHNVLRAPPEAYADPASEALARVEYLLRRMAGRVGVLLAAGHIAGSAAAAALSVPRRPDWNHPVAADGLIVLCVPHPSGASWAYNPVPVRQRTAAAIASVVAQAETHAAATKLRAKGAA